MTTNTSTPEAKPALRLIVVMEGGCVTDVYTSDPSATYEIIDWDDMRDQADDETDLDNIVDQRLEGLYRAE
jgi:hypothetical protein